jgi:hypothetical protein
MVTGLLPAIFELFAADTAISTVKLVRHEDFGCW